MGFCPVSAKGEAPVTLSGKAFLTALKNVMQGYLGMVVCTLRVKSRHLLRWKEQRELVGGLVSSPLLHRSLREEGRVRVERLLLEGGVELFLAGGRPWLVRSGGIVFPALPALLEGAVELPKVVVDMGAVPYVARGADVMVPGIVEVEGRVEAGDLVVVVDQTHRRPLAVGSSLMGDEEMRETGKGRAIRTLHHVGDRLWRLMEQLVK